MSTPGRAIAPETMASAERQAAATAIPVPTAAPCALLAEPQFLNMLCLERKRTERSGRPFVLMLLASARLLRIAPRSGAFEKVALALSRSIRGTDVKGWYREGSTIGVIFTEMGERADARAVTDALFAKITNALSAVLEGDQLNEITLSFHVFPDEWNQQGPGSPADTALYPERRMALQTAARAVKRMIDIAGSLFGLICLSPLLALIAALVKLTSQGPILFRQERLGHRGKPFCFLKFRSMYPHTGQSLHEEYMKNFISGSVETGKPQERGDCVYKLTHDPRVTPLGRFLRKTSLDELPQLINVLKGDMSLVGPRPPIPYEVARYQTWHRDRLLAMPPGITGLWQVEGRSKVTFDDMVRLDIQYSMSWSLWLDFKILLRTPRAVLIGAY